MPVGREVDIMEAEHDPTEVLIAMREWSRERLR